MSYEEEDTCQRGKMGHAVYLRDVRASKETY
jgi:hypothetical protein